eukprot:TRINITY_DN25788_c0_g1_i2.p1 TRINITY_DN25788_c0_g1~~TRINITY_DN25788_c0_g1_i2.p1  ORF type:complete len:297 (-),score=31.47 TRINITY_DN25788_c0_g1_i2:71-922(-)
MSQSRIVKALLSGAIQVASQLQDGYVRVPGCNGCLLHPSCVTSVANGVVVDEGFDLDCDRELLTSNEQVYAMDAHTDGSVVFKQMNTSWIVPALPAKSSHQTVFFWPGFKSQKPEPGYPVLQPVLQYGQRLGQSDWELQSWFVWAKRFPFPRSVTGPSIKVSAGDHITSWIDFDQSSQIWTVYGRNDANGQESILKVSNSKVGKMDFSFAMQVLETVMPSAQYCSLYPPDNRIEFSGIAANHGDDVNWIARAQKEDCHQQVTFTHKGDQVEFTWASNQTELLV